MSISSTTNRVTYTGNDAVDTYDYTFRIFTSADLLVTVKNTSTSAETTLVLTTDYTVTGVTEASGGTVVLVNASQAWLDGDGDLSSDYTITIRRKVSLTQTTDIRNQGDFFPETHEDTFDYGRMIDQQQQDEIDRSVKSPEAVPSSDFDPTLPVDIATANVVIITNPSGNGFIVGPTASEISGANASAVAAAASATLASEWASKVDGIVDTTDYSSKAWAIGGIGVTETASSGAAKEWSTKTDNPVDTSEFSAKEYAQGTQTRGASGGGSAKDWANYTSGTVDDTEYSAKKYATDAAASAASAATQLASAFFTDAIFYTSASSPVTLTSTDNGKLHVFDSSGGAITVNFPEISSISTPFNMAFLLQTSGNDVTFNRGGASDTIAGSTTKILSQANTGFQAIADTDPTPDTWSVLEFGSVGDGTVTKAKLSSGTLYRNITEISAADSPYTVLSTDQNILVNSISGDTTLVLPASASNSGKTISVKRVDDELEKTGDFIDGDVTVGSDTLNISSHSFTDLQRVQASTTGTLPAGLSTSTDYYIIYVDSDNVKLASSIANAVADTAVDITAAAGGGTHTLTSEYNLVVVDANGSEKIDQLDNFSITSRDESAVFYLDSTGVKVDSSHLTGFKEIELAADFTASSPVNGTWQSPNPALSVTVQPGTWNLNLQAMAGVLSATCSAGDQINFEVSFATSSTAGTGIFKTFTTHFNSYASNNFSYSFDNYIYENYSVTSETTVYVHIRWRSFSGSPTITTLGFRSDSGTGNGYDPLLVAKRIK